MNLSQLSRQQLVELIQKASAELAQRMSDPSIERVKHAEPVRILREPPEDDKDFLMAIKGCLLQGQYATAAERHRVAEIAGEYPEWVKQQRMPTVSNAGEWRRAAASMTMRRAKER